METKEMQEMPAVGNTCLEPRNMAEAIEFAKWISESGLVPKDYQNKPANVLVAMQWGNELGLKVMQAIQAIAVINGRPSIWGDAMLAICQAHPQFVSINETQTSTEAKCTVERRQGGKVSTTVQTFSMEDAKRAGLAGKQGSWTTYPKRMLQMRARAFALRDSFADALRGMQSAEEVQDIPVERDMGMATVVEKDQPKPQSKSAAVKKKARAKKAEAVDESTGEVLPAQMALRSMSFEQLVEAFGNCETVDRFNELQAIARAIYLDLPDAQRGTLADLIEAGKEEFSG